MHFSLSEESSDIRKDWATRVRVQLIILWFFIVGILYVLYPIVPSDRERYPETVAFFIFAGIFLSFLFVRKQRGVSEFDITEEGVLANGKVYQWSSLKHFHWYGEAQSERLGFVRMFPKLISYDPINPYLGTGQSIMRIRRKGPFPRYLNLKVNASRSEELVGYVERYGVPRLSATRMFIGGSASIVVVLVVIIVACAVYVLPNL